MEMQLQMTKSKIVKFLVFNIILIIVLYCIPIEKADRLCLYKMITGNECWNCGMTRAFLSILHLQFGNALAYNYNVIIVFPLTVTIYLYTWIKYIKRSDKNE